MDAHLSQSLVADPSDVPPTHARSGVPHGQIDRRCIGMGVDGGAVGPTQRVKASPRSSNPAPLEQAAEAGSEVVAPRTHDRSTLAVSQGKAAPLQGVERFRPCPAATLGARFHSRHVDDRSGDVVGPQPTAVVVAVPEVESQHDARPHGGVGVVQHPQDLVVGEHPSEGRRRPRLADLSRDRPSLQLTDLLGKPDQTHREVESRLERACGVFFTEMPLI